MDAFTTRLSKTLREQLEADAHDASHKLTIAVEPDYAGYREKVGLVKGLKHALALLSEIEKELGRAESAESLPIYTGRRSYED